MESDMSLDPLSGMDIINLDSETTNSPKSLSEFDKLKMELEQELSMESGPVVKQKSSEAHDEAQMTRPSDFKTSGSKKAKGCHGEKGLSSTPPEGSIHPLKEKQNNLTVTVKIFDRGLVVNGFSEDASLYSLSRAWMKNQKYSLASTQYNIFAILAAASKRQNNGADVLRHLQSGQTKFICSMPAIPPTKQNVQNSRIPSPEQLGVENQPDIAALNDALTQIPCETEEDHKVLKKHLLAQHRLKWKKTKSNWIKHVRNSDKQYEVNFTILETLYKSQMKCGSTVIESYDVKLN